MKFVDVMRRCTVRRGGRGIESAILRHGPDGADQLPCSPSTFHQQHCLLWLLPQWPDDHYESDQGEDDRVLLCP